MRVYRSKSDSGRPVFAADDGGRLAPWRTTRGKRFVLGLDRDRGGRGAGDGLLPLAGEQALGAHPQQAELAVGGLRGHPPPQAAEVSWASRRGSGAGRANSGGAIRR
jgi:hypothetical protein